MTPSEVSLVATAPAATLPTESVEVSACWNSRGVFGNSSCPELEQFIHCRNCPVYSAAGAQLLHRHLPAEYRREWTQHYGKVREERRGATVSAILFRLGEDWLALPTQLFQEVAERRCIHSLPHRRQGVVIGLANVRGELLICISLGHLLGLEKLPSREILRTRYDRLLVVSREGHRLGFPVDDVSGPYRFVPSDLKSPPATVSKSSPTFVQYLVYWRERAAGVLDPEAIFRALERRLE